MVIYMLPDSVFHLCSEDSRAPQGPHPFQALLEAGRLHPFPHPWNPFFKPSLNPYLRQSGPIAHRRAVQALRSSETPNAT